MEQNLNEKEKVRELALHGFLTNSESVSPILALLGYKTTIEKDSILLSDLDGNLIGTMFSGMASKHGKESTLLSIKTPNGVLSIITIPRGTCIIELASFNAVLGFDEYKEEKGISITLRQSANGILSEIDVIVSNPNAENKYIEFQTTPYLFEATWENAIGPYGNYIDGTGRTVKYCDFSKCPYHKRILFMSEEKVIGAEDKQIIVSRNESNQCKISAGESISGLTTKGTLYFDRDLTLEEAHQYSLGLLATPRVRDFVHYTLERVDENVPGIKNYIMENIPFVSEVISIMNNYQLINQDEEIKEITGACSLDSCNIPISKRKGKSKIEK